MTLKALFVQGRGTGLRAQNWQIWLPWLIGFSTACYHSNLKALANWFLQWGCYTDKHSPPQQQLQLPRLHTCAWLLPSELWLARKEQFPSILVPSCSPGSLQLLGGRWARGNLALPIPVLLPALLRDGAGASLKPLWACSKPWEGLLPKSGQTSGSGRSPGTGLAWAHGGFVPSEPPGSPQHACCASSQQWAMPASAGSGAKRKLLLDKLFK